MRFEFHPESIRFTSDGVGFDGFRAVVRELRDEDDVGSGGRGLPFFQFACRPVREKGCTQLRFQEDPHRVLTQSRISSLVPPDMPFNLNWHGAAGIVGTFEVHPLFFEEVLHRAGLAGLGFHSVPSLRFVINRRVDWLCQLLMQEAEQGCTSGRLYFENLATALLVAVVLQIDPRLPDAGHASAQLVRVQQAVGLMEVQFASKLTLEQLARVSGLSAFHFSRLFQRIMGSSPHQYLLRCRLRHAHALLSAGGKGRSLAELAAECGFADQAHFTRHFRRAYGLSPGKFKRAQG